MSRRILPALAPPLLLAGCSAAHASADAASGGRHTITWVDDVSYGKVMFGVSPAQTAHPICNSQAFGVAFISVFNESGAAVTSPARAVADPQPVANDAIQFTCRYRATITVDDAVRYRASRFASPFEATAIQGKSTYDYDYVDKSTLAAQHWLWNNPSPLGPQ